MNSYVCNATPGSGVGIHFKRPDLKLFLHHRSDMFGRDGGVDLHSLTEQIDISSPSGKLILNTGRRQVSPSRSMDCVYIRCGPQAPLMPSRMRPTLLRCRMSRPGQHLHHPPLRSANRTPRGQPDFPGTVLTDGSLVMSAFTSLSQVLTSPSLDLSHH